MGEVVDTIFETIGDRLSGILNAVLFDVFATIVRGILNLVANVVAGLIRIIGGGIGGLLAWYGRLFVRGVGDFFSGLAGAVVAILGKLHAFLQAVFLCSWGKGC